MASNQDPILELSTSRERRKIKIDGELYEVISPDEISWAHQAWFRKVAEEFRKAGESGDPDAIARLSSQLDEVLRRLLMSPDDVRSKLTDYQKTQVISAVFRTPGDGGLPTSGASSRPSSASTEAPGTNGSPPLPGL